MNPIRHASKHRKTPAARLRRVVIEHVRPEIDGGHFPIKRTVGEPVEVTADIHTDGHDVLSAVALHRAASETEWRAEEMRHLGNDRWAAQFRITSQESHVYTVQAWPDAFKSWARDLKKRSGAGQDLSLEFLIGAELVSAGAARAGEKDATKLRKFAAMLSEAPGKEEARKFAIAEGEELATLMARYPDLEVATKYEKAASSGSTTLPEWVLMCCTFRRFIQLEKRNGRGRTIRPHRGRTIQAARGPLDPGWAATKPFIRSSARCKTSKNYWRKREKRDWRLRWTWHSNVRPTIPM